MASIVQRSTDGGITFTVVPGAHGTTYPGWCDAIAVAPDDEAIIFWGGVALHRTEDGGNLWNSLSNVMGGGAQDNGVNFTTGGLSWTNKFGGDGGWIIFDPVDPRIIYAESQNANIVKSTDGGRTWAGKTNRIAGPRHTSTHGHWQEDQF
jgi:photosystem II stability/assembly factor-like uncharacterized protein